MTYYYVFTSGHEGLVLDDGLELRHGASAVKHDRRRVAARGPDDELGRDRDMFVACGVFRNEMTIMSRE